jgi:hypothetical protein
MASRAGCAARASTLLQMHAAFSAQTRQELSVCDGAQGKISRVRARDAAMARSCTVSGGLSTDVDAAALYARPFD